MRIVVCFSVLLVLGACGTVTEKGVYEGLRQEGQRRQYEPGRDLSRDPPPPAFDDYTKERQRLQQDSRP
jgi:hypothetical protein